MRDLRFEVYKFRKCSVAHTCHEKRETTKLGCRHLDKTKPDKLVNGKNIVHVRIGNGLSQNGYGTPDVRPGGPPVQIILTISASSPTGRDRSPVCISFSPMLVDHLLETLHMFPRLGAEKVEPELPHPGGVLDGLRSPPALGRVAGELPRGQSNASSPSRTKISGWAQLHIDRSFLC